VSSQPEKFQNALVDQALRCSRCGDVIGIYEPIIVVEAHEHRQTSAAAEPQVSRHRGEHYHRACYRADRDDRARRKRPPIMERPSHGGAPIGLEAVRSPV
jgi:hypothetical protein